MSNPMNKGSLFDPVLVTDLINKVKGHSSLQKLSKQTPVPFNGRKEFTFTMDSEIDVVAESGAKSHGGITLAPVTIVPIKIEYGARVSNEFMYATEEERIAVLQAFNEGFAKKVAAGLDKMAFHGINPRTGSASAVIGTNNFDSLVSQTVTYVAASANANVESAIALVTANEYEVNGMAMGPTFRSGLAALTDDIDRPLFPDLAWGNTPDVINGLPVDTNSTVESNSSKDRAILGDFENCFRWGYAKEIPLKVIEYGDPDNSGHDLQGYNQVYLRAEMFLGWGILDPLAFAIIKTS